MFIVAILLAAPAPAQDLLDGEFGDVTLGRKLIGAARLPSVRELREAVARPGMETVLMLKLHGDEDNHHLPIWPPDGRRIAFQRSRAAAATSKLLVFTSLSDEQPSLLTTGDDVYDYMFRWAVGGSQAFAFCRIEPRSQDTQVMFSAGGSPAEAKTTGPGQHVFPTVFERTDGIWRLAYEHEGRILHMAFSPDGMVEEPITLANGGSPRFSPDGQSLVFLRQRRAGGDAAPDVMLRDLRSGRETLLASPTAGVVRSPTFSPDAERVAWHYRPAGNRQPWSIQCIGISGDGAKKLGDEVVVNENFKSEGPCFEPGGRHIWYLSHTRRDDAYYPLLATDVESGGTVVVHYPRRCATPADLAVNPRSEIPEIALVGRDGPTQDLFVVLLNHY